MMNEIGKPQKALLTFRAEDILVEEVGHIQPKSKVAFCFNADSFHLLVSNSGHNAMLRNKDKRDYDFGGWCDLKSGRIWSTNGTVSNVPKKWSDPLAGALEDHFCVFLRWVS